VNALAALARLKREEDVGRTLQEAAARMRGAVQGYQ
jgi:hypothetical protein